ncbi:hypothetical protein [Streptomyces achromogenes]|uniref:hypothetical protein n=1 Tax=Streptomyces achromogenes TaxID=67255 RepID=UPI00369BC800
MTTTPHLKKAVSLMTPAFAVSAVVGIACAVGVATATTAVAATSTSHVATKATSASGYGRDVGDTVDEVVCGAGLVPILDFCG